MLTDAIATLVKGGRRLTLSAGRFALGRDFRPPGDNTDANLAAGTSANRSGGSSKVGERANDRVWSFSVHIQNCASVREVEQAVADLGRMLDQAGDEDEPLYLEYRASSAIAVPPLWGQGVLRFEIIHSRFELSELYATASLRGRNLPTCPLELRVKPHALGLPQRLGSAMGAVLVDNYGTVDGQPRGVIVAPAASSAFTNPIFGNSTWNSGWTTGASLTAASNTDPAFLLPDSRVSALLTSRANSDRNLTQNLTLANGSPYIISALVKLPDSSSPTGNDLLLFRSSSSAACFFNVGNGIWEAAASVTGNGAACNTGITIVQGRSVYLLGMQTSPSIRMPFMHGDQLGSAWDGTAHNSATTRTGGRVRWLFDDVLKRGQGTIRFVYQFKVGTSTCATQRIAHADNTGTFALQYQSGSQFLFQDGTNSLVANLSAASAGQRDVVHCTYGPAGLFVYHNGVLAGSSATYTPPFDGDYLYLGTNSAGVLPAGGTFLDFTTWPVQATATEVANDYADVRPVVSDGMKVSDIPWLWTKDGDDRVDNGDSGASENWCAVAGVPGTAPAQTLVKGVVSGAAGGDDIYLSLLALRTFFNPSALVTNPVSVVSVSTSDTELATITLSQAVYEQLAGRTLIPMVGGNEDGAQTLSMRTKINPGGTFYYSDYSPTLWRTSGTDRSIDTTPALDLLVSSPNFDRLGVTRAAVEIGVDAKRSTGTADFNLDSIQFLVKPFVRLKNIQGDIGTGPTFLYQGRTVYQINAGALEFTYAHLGDVLEFEPGRINILFAYSGTETRLSSIGQTIDYTVLVTPRYKLL